MVSMYLVHFEARPTAGSAEFGQAGGAMVDVYVRADSLVEATQKAIAYVNSRLWVVTDELAALKMTPERIAAMDKIGRSTYRRAQEEGLFSFFTAWPPKDREDDIVEVRALRDDD